MCNKFIKICLSRIMSESNTIFFVFLLFCFFVFECFCFLKTNNFAWCFVLQRWGGSGRRPRPMLVLIKSTYCQIYDYNFKVIRRYVDDRFHLIITCLSKIKNHRKLHKIHPETKPQCKLLIYTPKTMPKSVPFNKTKTILKKIPKFPASPTSQKT
jgi:hypothetical protein